ncbi:DUF3370 domain-containing protein [Cyanobium sp. Aljojuca 7D2]|uniref:DUF3370 domain-containing protein n=1 Tax=Cyanobium sp. Aljojuca 7D2 TaxID=2823698 RepID=UPI0020CC28F6|nr:DUF3370 domain-containing protein [Cyanobium sp. Aljojuca 7D2]MCP9890444.1 DUF3370 domain-containing protein [Cyanobium sp. Aljojuca 7D2]
MNPTSGRRRARLPLLLLAVLAAPTSALGQIAPTKPTAPAPVLRPQTVAPLSGSLDRVLLVNDNNPELIREPGILLSTFPGSGRGVPSAHLDVALSGRFDLFSHHVYAGKPESLDSTLWLAVLAAPRGPEPVMLKLLSGSTALSQAVEPGQASAPFLPLPALMAQGSTPVWAGPGSRVATELLARQRSPQLPASWTLPPGAPSTLVVLPLPVRGLDPLLNGLNLQMRLESSGPVSLATLAAFGSGNQPPAASTWAALLEGGLSPREHAPTPRGSKGGMVYSRVSGVQVGSVWRTRLTDPGQRWLSVRRAPISWPISSLERGTLGTGQVQTAELQAFYPGTAWAAHGNYGVEYDLSIPLRNDTAKPVALQLALESPIKGDSAAGGLRFHSIGGITSGSRPVMFRGTVEVTGLDGEPSASGAPVRPAGRRSFHLVQRAGEPGPALGTVSLAPGASRQLQVRLIYPADATPPQVLSLLPVPEPAVKQSKTTSASHP